MNMKKVLLYLFLLLFLALVVFSFVATRDGELVTPEGSGVVNLSAGQFEAFTLPDYAAKHLGELSGAYKSYFVEVEPGIKVHVLEVGSGFPVFMQHGNPTSGFLYRKVAEKLASEPVRLILPTLVGLGFSSKVPASMHTLDNHIRWINAVLNQLELNKLIYVGQDWGGPVGMGALAKSPGVLQGAVVMNTGFNAPTRKADLSSAHARVKTPIVGELLIEGVFSIFDQLHQVQGDPKSIPPEIRRLYREPVLSSGNAKAPLALMRMVPDGPDHPSSQAMRQIEAYVQTLNIPVEIVWGMKDPILAAGLSSMMANFPQGRVTKTQAGHFLQEEVPTEIAQAVMRLIQQMEKPDE